MYSLEGHDLWGCAPRGTVDSATGRGRFSRKTDNLFVSRKQHCILYTYNTLFPRFSFTIKPKYIYGPVYII